MAALAGTCFYVITSILHCLPQPKQGAVPPCSSCVAHSACSVCSCSGVYDNYGREAICCLQGQGSNKVPQKVHPAFLVINHTSA